MYIYLPDAEAALPKKDFMFAALLFSVFACPAFDYIHDHNEKYKSIPMMVYMYALNYLSPTLLHWMFKNYFILCKFLWTLSLYQQLPTYLHTFNILCILLFFTVTFLCFWGWWFCCKHLQSRHLGFLCFWPCHLVLKPRKEKGIDGRRERQINGQITCMQCRHMHAWTNEHKKWTNKLANVWTDGIGQINGQTDFKGRANRWLD